MSMSVRDDDDRPRVGRRARRAPGSSRPGATLLRPAYLRMLTEIPRFHRRARALLAARRRGDARRRTTTRRCATFLDARRLLGVLPPPLHGAAGRRASGPATRPSRWTTRRATCSPSSQHHGMLGIFGSPQWRTVTGGSREYVDAVAAGLARRPHRHQGDLGARDRRRRRGHRRQRRGRRRTTPSWSPPTPARRWRCSPSRPPPSARCSAAMPYSPNTALLHTDTSLLPRAPRAPGRRGTTCAAPAGDRGPRHRHLRPDPAAAAAGTDDPLPRHPRRRGPRRPGDRDRPMEYEHPLYTPASVAAQRRLPEFDTDRIAFAGAYHGWGFHEDGARSGVERRRAARPARGAPASRAAGADVEAAAVYAHHDPAHPPHAVPAHLRAPLAHLARRPRRPARPRRCSARFEARDHLGDPDAHAARQRRALPRRQRASTPSGGRILMAAHAAGARPLLQPDQRVLVPSTRRRRSAGVVVEVHNTYGDRHAYLVHPDEQGRARTDKADVRLAVPRHRRPLRARRAAPGRPAARRGHAAHATTAPVFSASLDRRRAPTTSPAARAAPAALRGTAPHPRPRHLAVGPPPAGPPPPATTQEGV